MAYDESIYRRQDTGSTDAVGAGAWEDSRYGGDPPGYHDHLGARSAAGQVAGQFMGGESVEPGVSPAPGRRRALSPAALDDVFDDPAHGEPGRDRLGVHLLWEVALLLAVVAQVYLFYRDYPDAIRGAELDNLLVFGTAVGLLALGTGLTLRTGAPNLAVGPVAVASALHFAENSDRGVVEAVGPAAVAALALALLVAVLVVGFHVPGWAASLAAGLAVIVYIQQRSAPVDVQGDYDPAQHAIYLFGGFATVTLIAGLFGTAKAVRRSIGRFRPVGDPAMRRGGVAATITAIGIVVSMLFAMLAGVLLAAGGSGPVQPTTGIEWTGLALGAALVGGTSAFGRRGGIVGPLLSVVVLTLFIRYADERNLDIALAAIAAAAVAAGLVVTRLVESYGRPRSAAEPEEEWGEPGSAAASNWSAARADRPEPWNSSLPGQPTESRTDPWGADRWGGSDR